MVTDMTAVLVQKRPVAYALGADGAKLEGLW